MTTEWEEIQRKFGNLPPAEVVVTENELQNMVDDAAAAMTARERYERMSLRDLNHAAASEPAANDDEDEDRLLHEYRARRLAELRAQSRGEHFGTVLELHSRSSFVTEVTSAKAGLWVVCLLYGLRDDNSAILGAAVEALAAKFPGTKFARIQAQRCIAELPESAVPTLLVYRDGALQRQFTGLKEFGGRRLTVDDVEWELAQTGAVVTELDESPHVTVSNRIFVNIQRKGDGASGC